MQNYLPYRQTNKKSPSYRIKLYFLFLLLALTLIGIFYVIVISPIFKIQSIEIKNSGPLKEETILYTIKPLIFRSFFSNFLGENNILAWPQGKIAINGTEFSQALISKRFFKKKVTIEVVKREKIAIWCISNDKICYWIDKDGVAFKSAPATEGGLIFTVSDPQKNELILGSKVIDERFLNNLVTILSNISKINLPIKKLEFARDLQELKVQTYNGPDVLFSVRFDPSSNMGAIESLGLKESLKDFQYIDLRVENKIYTKHL